MKWKGSPHHVPILHVLENNMSQCDLHVFISIFWVFDLLYPSFCPCFICIISAKQLSSGHLYLFLFFESLNYLITQKDLWFWGLSNLHLFLQLNLVLEYDFTWPSFTHCELSFTLLLKFGWLPVFRPTRSIHFMLPYEFLRNLTYFDLCPKNDS